MLLILIADYLDGAYTWSVPSLAPSRFTIITLRWASTILVVYLLSRFILAVPAAMVGAASLLHYFNILLLLFAILYLMGIYSASNLPFAKAGGNHLAFSAAVVSAITLCLLSFLLTLLSWPATDVYTQTSLGWSYATYVILWFGSLIFLAGGLLFVVGMYHQQLLKDTTCIQLVIGLLGLTINWLTAWPTAFNLYALPLTFLALGGIGVSTGIRQLIVMLDRGEDVVVSSFDS